MKILIVLTSHDQLGDTGKKTGFWLEEFAAPYYVFKDAGAAITLASPKCRFIRKFGISGANLSNCRKMVPSPKWGIVRRMPVNKDDR
jgi:putative intracellular protease/amidase